MKKQISRNSSTPSNMKLRSLIMGDPELLGELVDAAICNDIAHDLYNLRRYRGLTQAQLAEKLNVKQSNISRWETPGYQGYKVKVLSKIARALRGRLSIRIAPLNTYQFNLSFKNYTAFLDDISHTRTYNRITPDTKVLTESNVFEFTKAGF